MINYQLYLITDDPSRYATVPWLDNVVATVEGGVTCVQYRDTESPRQVQFERIRALQDALRGKATPIVVNNDAELAAAVGAQGVHVGQHDLPPEQVRKIVGPDCEIGYSITSLAEALAFRNQSSRNSLASRGPYRLPSTAVDCRRPPSTAVDCPRLPSTAVDCLGIGPVFDATKTKADAAPAMGLEGLRSIVETVPEIANCAIGGITLANAPSVLAAGAKGLAIVSAFSQSEDPYATAKDFTLLFDHRRQ